MLTVFCMWISMVYPPSTVAEMSAQEERRLDLTRRLADQYRQREG
jgi:hypothetical protein